MMSRRKRYDIYDGDGLDDFPNEQWVMSLEADNTAHTGVDRYNPLATWDSYAEIPEFVRRRLSALFMLDVCDNEGDDYMWSKGGFTLLLTDEEANLIIEENTYETFN